MKYIINQVRKRVYDVRKKVYDLAIFINKLYDDIGDSINNIETYKRKDGLTFTQKEQIEWLENAGANLEDIISLLENDIIDYLADIG